MMFGNMIGDHSETKNDYSGNNDSQFVFWQLIHILRRFWWLIAVIVFVIMGIVWSRVSNITPLYRSMALLEVKQEERNLIDVSQVERVIANDQFLNTQIELLQSLSLMEDTVERLNLLNDVSFAPVTNTDWRALPRDERMRLVVGKLSRGLSVSAVGRTRLIQVSYVHSSPEKSALLSNAIVETFLENELSRRFNTTISARQFLEKRLVQVRSSLEVAERELVDYASQSGILIIDGENTDGSTGSLDASALKALSEQLTKASSERAEAEQILRQAQENEFLEVILSNEYLTTLKRTRFDLNSEYVEKLAVYKPGFPEMIELKSRIDLIDGEIEQKTVEIVSSLRGGYKNDYALSLAKEEGLKKRVANVRNSVVDLRERGIDYNILQRQVETERTQYEALLQRLKEVSVADEIGGSLIEVVDEASAPRAPFNQDKTRAMIVAFLLSSAIGLGLAYAITIIDDRIRDPDDVKQKLNQILMGVIPLVNKKGNLLESLADHQTGISEAYASLRTNLQFSGENGGPRIIQTTSTRGGEGKSVTSLSLALRFSAVGFRVLIIDADMRLPTFKTLSSRPSSVGLSGVLTQAVEFEEHVGPTGSPGLDLLPSGVNVPNPSELLSSQKFDALLKWAASKYDYVVVDSPPVLGLADAPIIGAKVEGTLVAIEANRLRTPNVRASIERLNASGTKILGVVLTKYKAKHKGYMDYYQYSYGNAALDYDKGAAVTKDGGKVKRVSKEQFDLS